MHRKLGEHESTCSIVVSLLPSTSCVFRLGYVKLKSVLYFFYKITRQLSSQGQKMPWLAVTSAFYILSSKMVF